MKVACALMKLHVKFQLYFYCLQKDTNIQKCADQVPQVKQKLGPVLIKRNCNTGLKIYGRKCAIWTGSRTFAPKKITYEQSCSFNFRPIFVINTFSAPC